MWLCCVCGYVVVIICYPIVLHYMYVEYNLHHPIEINETAICVWLCIHTSISLLADVVIEVVIARRSTLTRT